MRFLSHFVACLVGVAVGALAVTVHHDRRIPPTPAAPTVSASIAPNVTNISRDPDLLPQVPAPTPSTLPSPTPTKLPAIPVTITPATIEMGNWRFVSIPAGFARVGSPDDEPGHQPEEKLRIVPITGSFYLLETEVPRSLVEFSRTGSSSGNDQHPAIDLSFDDACEICQELQTRVPELRFRLPTPLEWEHAARQLCMLPIPIPVSETDRWHAAFSKWKAGDAEFLNRFTKQFACFGESRPNDCGQLRPNSIGLFDMAGNVWEWCDAEHPRSPELRPVMGGAWSSTSLWNCRSASCSWEKKSAKKNSIGFRLVVEPR